jgi:uncharacterized membrane protein
MTVQINLWLWIALFLSYTVTVNWCHLGLVLVLFITCMYITIPRIQHLNKYACTYVFAGNNSINPQNTFTAIKVYYVYTNTSFVEFVFLNNPNDWM